MITKKYFTDAPDVIIGRDFGGARYKPAKNGVYLMAHTDTVHKRRPTAQEIYTHNGIWTAPDVGLGADDRAGVYIVKRLKNRFPDCGYLLSPDEETGDFRFMGEVPKLDSPKVFIMFDRKGVNNYVDYGHGCKAIEDYLEYDGVMKERGSYSSCKRMAELYGVPCVNLCIGGDGFHFRDEYLDVEYLERMLPVYQGLVKFCADPAVELEVEPPPPKVVDLLTREEAAFKWWEDYKYSYGQHVDDTDGDYCDKYEACAYADYCDFDPKVCGVYGEQLRAAVNGYGDFGI